MTLRSHLVDATPFRENSDFRAFVLGSAASAFGSQMSTFALIYFVWEHTRSATVVGLFGVVQGVPLLVCGLLGGHVADRMNRRTLLTVTRTAQLVVSAVTAGLILAGMSNIVVVAALLAGASGLSALGAPAAHAIAPRMLRPQELSARLALSRIAFQIAMLGGPAAAGLVVASAGVGACVVVDAATFLAALWGIRRIPSDAATPQRDLTERGDSFFADLAAGLSFVTRSREVRAAFLIDLAATVLALPTALFPIINSERFGGSPVTLGLMLPAVGAGGVIAGLVSGRLTSSRYQGRIMLVSCAVWGAMIVGFGASANLALALACLFIAGAADTCTVISRESIVQLSTPDAIRGRVNSLDYLVGAGGPSLGDVRAGSIAGVTSGSTSALLGGAACLLATGAIAVASPALRRWRRPT